MLTKDEARRLAVNFATAGAVAEAVAVQGIVTCTSPITMITPSTGLFTPSTIARGIAAVPCVD